MSTFGLTGEVRWGILGGARIAKSQFLPGLREAGGGRPSMVASRDLGRAEAFARDNEVDMAVEGYETVVESADIDAVYVALPNSHHAYWTQRTLQAGKVVLCEKPLCVSPAETEAVLQTAATTGALLWEAFVFPFQAQHRRLLELLASGAIGEVRELASVFHFHLSGQGDHRLSADLGGGALADVGCYPVRLAQEVLDTRDLVPGKAVGFCIDNGAVDTESIAVISYEDQQLVLSCGFMRAYDTFTRVLGTKGQIHLTNPFHPTTSDSLILRHEGEEMIEHPTVDARSFTAALRHIHAVMRGDEAPAHLARESSLRSARTLEAIARACSAPQFG